MQYNSQVVNKYDQIKLLFLNAAARTTKPSSGLSYILSQFYTFGFFPSRPTAPLSSSRRFIFRLRAAE